MKLFLRQQFTPKILFDRNNNFKPDASKAHEMNININFDISVTYKPNPNVKYEYLVDLQLAWNDINSPVTLDIVTCGVFKIRGVSDAEEIDKDTLNSLLRVDAAEILFPFLRERISNITSNGGLPPLIIPHIDFDKIYATNIKQPTLQ